MNPENIKHFFSKIMQNGNCWEWIGCIHKSGYGQFGFDNVTVYAHRVSYELFKYNIPKGLQLDHLCRNRNCVNPDHLEVVTQQENIRRGLAGQHNRIKNNCPQGHKYSGKNNRNSRICQKCLVINTIKYRKRKRNNLEDKK